MSTILEQREVRDVVRIVERLGDGAWISPARMRTLASPSAVSRCPQDDLGRGGRISGQQIAAETCRTMPGGAVIEGGWLTTTASALVGRHAQRVPVARAKA